MHYAYDVAMISLQLFTANVPGIYFSEVYGYIIFADTILGNPILAISIWKMGIENGRYEKY